MYPLPRMSSLFCDTGNKGIARCELTDDATEQHAWLAFWERPR